MRVARPVTAGPAPVADTSAIEWMTCGDGSETFLTLPAHIAGAEARAMLVPPAWAFAAPVVLGLPLLMRFRCLIDFARAHAGDGGRRIRQGVPARSLGPGVVHRGDRLEVIHVAADSPAARAGLNAGDSIVAINHEAVGTRGARNQRNLGKRLAGTRYIVSVRTKGDREVILEEYY